MRQPRSQGPLPRPWNDVDNNRKNLHVTSTLDSFITGNDKLQK